MVHGVEMPEVERRAVVVDIAAQKTTCVFESRRKARTPAWESRIPLAMVEGEAGNQRVRVKVGEIGSTTCARQGLILPCDYRAEEISGRWIDLAGFGMIHSEIQTCTIPNFERIAREHVEAQTLLLEIQGVLKTRSRRKLARV